ncbi:hypothetical protein PQR75_18725 [Paraburkholderia fungorum]|uniref:ApeA N-terminal domain 1-containing protein n=1 Tax=Paraburkholderia fungorum TaxID=134537 RepID=UPI0038B6C54C
MAIEVENEFEEPGYFWWRDEKYSQDHFASDKGVNGHLKIKKNGEIHLELDGLLPRKKHKISGVLGRRKESEAPRAIQGITKYSGKRVLLVDAVYNGGSFHSNRFTWERYLATICLMGDADFPRTGVVPTFSLIELDLTGLENWFVLGTLQVTSSSRTLRLRIDETKNIVYQTPYGRIALEKRTEIDGSNGMHHYAASVREHMSMSVRRSPAFKPEEIATEFGALQDLFTLLSGSSYQLKWPQVVLAGGKRSFICIFRRIGGVSKVPELHELPLKFDDLKGQFGEIYASWRNKLETYGPGFFSYLSTKRDVKLYVENHFSNLIQGLESFHRTKHHETPVVAGLQEKIDRILNDIQRAKDREWLSARLQHAAEPNLGERLRVLFTSLPLDIDHGRLTKFATECAHLRNDIAHFGGRRARSQTSTFLRDTSLKNEVIGYFYHMILLKEIGVSDEAIRSWTSDSIEGFRYRSFLEMIGFCDASNGK